LASIKRNGSNGRHHLRGGGKGGKSIAPTSHGTKDLGSLRGGKVRKQPTNTIKEERLSRRKRRKKSLER